MAEDESRIRERAYHLWEADGRPHGRELEYWERARELIAIENNPQAGQLPNPMTHPHWEGPFGEPVEEAEIELNLGEFPGRQADQGEDIQTPLPVKKRRRVAPKK